MLRPTLIAALTLASCSDDGGVTAHDTSGSTAGATSGTSLEPTSTGGSTASGEPTTEAPSRQLVVPDDFMLCSQSLHQALEQGSLFRSKARVTLGAGHYDVSDAREPGDDGGTTAPFSIPLGIEHQLDLAGPRSYMIVPEEAIMNRSEDAVIAPQWMEWSMPGYQTVRVFQHFVADDDAPTAWKPFGRPALGLAVSDVDSADVLRLDMAAASGFSMPVGFGGALAPCAGPGASTIVDRITLEGSEIEFEVRKEALSGGTMLRASGEIEGAGLDESDFWNLEYGVTSADSQFGQLPFYAVRFPQTAEGECGLWIGWWAMEEREAAFFLDCSLNKVTREVEVVAIERLSEGG